MLTGTLPQKLCLLVLLGLHSVGLQLTLGGVVSERPPYTL